MLSLTHTSILPFGKYKGHTVGQVLTWEPGYIGWMIEDGVAQFPKKLRRHALKKLREERDEAENEALDRYWSEAQH